MWITSLLTAGTAAIGRVLTVSLLPNSILAIVTWALLRAHSFSGRSNWALVLPRNLGTDILPILLLLIGILVSSVLIQPIQIRLIRVLEGYWQSWSITARIAPFFAEWQYQRKSLLKERHTALASKLEAKSNSGLDFNTGLRDQLAATREKVRDRAKLERAEDKLNRYPPDEVSLLPTILGNALRMGETTAGERYGLDTLTSWPRLYPQLSDRLVKELGLMRDSLDASVNMCISFFLTFLLTAAALYDQPFAYWIPMLAIGLCIFSYLGSIAAAISYARLIQVAYDLHRFDLLKALHYKLPKNRKKEKLTFETLSLYFTKAVWNQSPETIRTMSPLLPYDHSASASKDDKPTKTQ